MCFCLASVFVVVVVVVVVIAACFCRLFRVHAACWVREAFQLFSCLWNR